MADVSTAPVRPTGNVNDLFGALLELQWRGIGVPYSRLETEVRQDLVIHKFIDRDGAYVEGTGRHPLQITARIPLLNGLTRGTQETWSSGLLYPGTWRALFVASLDRRSGTVQHPELGPLNCKIETLKSVWDANVRSGVWVDAAWVESDDTGVDLQQDLAQPSPLANIATNANDLDAQIASINPKLVPQLPPLQFTFTQLSNAVRGAFDAATIMQKQYGGRLDNILYQCAQLQGSLHQLDQAANANALNWPIFQATERMKSAAYAAKQYLLGKGRPLGTYVLPKAMTLAQVAAQLGASIQDIMQLNASLLGTPVLTRGTSVSYYLKAA